jgi:DegV family protein with EDD domain
MKGFLTMADYILMTDSTADLPWEYYAAHEVKVISLSYNLDGVPGIDETAAADNYRAFYAQLRAGKQSTTSQITSEQYIEFMTPLLETGKDILYIAFSSGLSGSCDSAMHAAGTLQERFPERRVRVVDSLAASMGEGLLVAYAVKRRDAGESLDQVADWVESNKQNLHHWFTVDDLNHLKRGGRVSGSSAMIGTLLSIKPVLHVNEAGKLIPVEKARSRKKSIKKLFEKLVDNAAEWDHGLIGISHGDCLEDALYLKGLVEKEYACEEIIVSCIGSVVGSHSGAGTIAFFFLSGNRTISK